MKYIERKKKGKKMDNGREEKAMKEKSKTQS